MSKTSQRTEKLREQSTQELTMLLEEAKHDLFRLRVRSTTKELINPNEIPMKKREIARIKTILTEKTRQAS